MRDFTDYQPDIEQPYKQHFITTYWYSSGKTVAIQSAKDTGPQYLSMSDRPALGPLVHEKVINESAYKVAMDSYRGMVNRRRQQFYDDLNEEFGIEDNSKRELLHEKVRMICDNTSDFRQLYDVTSDLVDLIR